MYSTAMTEKYNVQWIAGSTAAKSHRDLLQ